MDGPASCFRGRQILDQFENGWILSTTPTRGECAPDGSTELMMHPVARREWRTS